MAQFTEYAHGQFNWVDLSATDLAAAKAFYSDLFGWEAVDQDTQGGPPYTIFQQDGQQIAGLGELPEELRAQGVPPSWNNYVNVDDLEATVAQCQQHGGAVPMPPMQVLDAGSMAMIQDPGGAHLFLWQKDKHIGAQLANVVGTFCWNELATRDVDQAQAFFGKLFGWTFQKNDDSPSTYYNIHLGERMNGGLMQMTEEWGDMPPHWSVYFHVADVDAFAEKLKALGGKVIQGPFPTPAGPIVVCTDAQGAAFNAIQMTVDPD